MKRGISIELDSGNPAGDRLFERAGFAVLGVLVALAAAGLLGTGSLTRGTLQRDGLEISYPHTSRMQENIEIDIVLPSGTDSLLWDRELLDVLQIDSISPEPEEVHLVAGESFRWDFSEPETSGGMRIHIHARPRHGGLIRGSVKSLNSESIPFTLFIYP